MSRISAPYRGAYSQFTVASTPRDMATVPDLEPKKVKRAPLYLHSLIDEASRWHQRPKVDKITIVCVGRRLNHGQDRLGIRLDQV